MATNKTDVLVYIDLLDANGEKLLGTLYAHQAKARKTFSFQFHEKFLASEKPILLDPDISWNKGQQFPLGKSIFGIFNDAMPDTWGRTLMKRREAQMAKEEGRAARTLYELDFLLGVNDESRMGALRFKLAEDGPFLHDDTSRVIPPWSSIRELQHGIDLIESERENKEVRKWLHILLAPGSSLGGARPKANILDEKGNLWIAKFPSKADTIDKGAWEFLAHQLALKAGIAMTECRMEKISGKYHTFFTKRFDRIKHQRIHFASAMTMTGNNEDTIKDSPPSYLDIAEFIQFNESNNKNELAQLWRRMVFNIAISNSDDHLRNHGFLLQNTGWQLSPAYDLNPSIDKDGLSLNIDTDNNALDFDLALNVGQYFQLSEKQMLEILNEVKAAVKTWKNLATKIGISKSEISLMSSAFKY
jgi:serine/threonine-protein kinase HipA